MAKTIIPTEQAIRIEKEILDRLGVARDCVVANSLSFDSDGRVSIDFYVPRSDLEAIINGTD